MKRIISLVLYCMLAAPPPDNNEDGPIYDPLDPIPGPTEEEEN